MFENWSILSLLIWLPIFGGFVVFMTCADKPETAKRIALGVSVAAFVLSILLFNNFDRTTYEMQFTEFTSWITSFNINYHLGVDGISVPLILLTTFTTVLVVIAGWEVIKFQLSQYVAAFLIMEGLIIGVFSALDAVLFYMFFETMLIPMFLIIGIWGGERQYHQGQARTAPQAGRMRKNQASRKNLRLVFVVRRGVHVR